MASMFEIRGQLSLDLNLKFKKEGNIDLTSSNRFKTLLNGREAIVLCNYNIISVFYEDSGQLEIFYTPIEENSIGMQHYFIYKPDSTFLEISYSELGYKDSKYFINAGAAEFELAKYVDQDLSNEDDLSTIEDKPASDLDLRNIIGLDIFDAYYEISGTPGVGQSSIIGDRGYEDTEELTLKDMLNAEKKLDTQYNKSGMKLS